MTATRPDIDLTDGNFYADSEAARAAYKWMREHEPVFRDRNGLAAAEVLPSEVPVTYLFTVPWWPALVALACAALAAIFRHGARLQRDTEGLV